MNNSEYGKILKTYFYENLLNRINPNMRLKRKSKTGIKPRISPNIPNGIYDISNIADFGEYNSIVERFKQVLDTKLSHCNNRGFYERIESLKIEEQEQNLKNNSKASASYSARLNKLEIYLKKIGSTSSNNRRKINEEVITHELLHMATTYKKGQIILCGFGQTIGLNSPFAVGINEGYTELLNMRYFSNKRKSNAYIQEQLIALGIEQIVGRKEMESLYFNADLKGLIERVGKYSSIEEVTNLITHIDEARKLKNYSPEEYKKEMTVIRAKIANINMEKQRQLLMSGQITTDEYDYENLKSAFYVKGYILEKFENIYSIKKHNETTSIILPQEGYRIIRKKFNKEEAASRGFTADYAMETEDDIINGVSALNYLSFTENRDLSQIESIEVLELKTKNFLIIDRNSHKEQRNTQELQTQLDKMFERPPIEK